MWKYCVEINQIWMREDLVRRLIPKHYNYVEQRYFRTKKEAIKGYSEAIRESKEMLNERKRIVNNCHEKVIMEREENKMVFLGIKNGFSRGPIEDEIVISIKKTA